MSGENKSSLSRFQNFPSSRAAVAATAAAASVGLCRTLPILGKPGYLVEFGNMNAIVELVTNNVVSQQLCKAYDSLI
jgi:hypothetical protein